MVRLGQANEVISPEGGTPKYGLYTYEMGWIRVEGGWSLMPSDGEFAGMWLFGFDED